MGTILNYDIKIFKIIYQFLETYISVIIPIKVYPVDTTPSTGKALTVEPISRRAVARGMEY